MQEANGGPLSPPRMQIEDRVQRWGGTDMVAVYMMMDKEALLILSLRLGTQSG